MKMAEIREPHFTVVSKHGGLLKKGDRFLFPSENGREIIWVTVENPSLYKSSKNYWVETFGYVPIPNIE